jgi:hypothetical protein
MNNVDEVTASRLIFALMRAFSASVAEMPLQGIQQGSKATDRYASSAFGLVAEVLRNNTPMLEVFEHGGFAMTSRRKPGVAHVTLRLR